MVLAVMQSGQQSCHARSEWFWRACNLTSSCATPIRKQWQVKNYFVVKKFSCISINREIFFCSNFFKTKYFPTKIFHTKVLYFHICCIALGKLCFSTRCFCCCVFCRVPLQVTLDTSTVCLWDMAAVSLSLDPKTGLSSCGVRLHDEQHYQTGRWPHPWPVLLLQILPSPIQL